MRRTKQKGRIRHLKLDWELIFFRALITKCKKIKLLVISSLLKRGDVIKLRGHSLCNSTFLPDFLCDPVRSLLASGHLATVT